MRERLAQHYQTTHIFTGQFRSYSKTSQDSNVACFSNICIEGQVWVADHVWIHRSKHMKQLELTAGDCVQFEARVGHYSISVPRPHVEGVEWDYCLEKVREFIVVQRHREGVNGNTE